MLSLPVFRCTPTLLICLIVFNMLGCASVNDKTLDMIHGRDLYTELEVLEQELANDPHNKKLLSRVQVVKSQLVAQLRDAATRMDHAGWPEGAGEMYQRAYEIGGNGEDLARYLEARDKSTRHRVAIARSLEAAELGYSKRAVEELLEMDEEGLTFPSVKGLREAVQSEARGKAVRQLGNFHIDEYSIRYLDFIQECSRREPDHEELKKIVQKTKDRIECERNIEVTEGLLKKERFSEALAIVKIARTLNRERGGLDDLERTIVENWAFSVYNDAVQQEREGTKRSLAKAQQLFNHIEKDIYPAYRDAYDRYHNCRETLADLYYHEAVMFLRLPRLSKVFLAKACADKALEWNEDHEQAQQLKLKADRLCHLMKTVRVRVEVTGEDPFASSLESQLVHGLNPNGYSWMDIHPGVADGVSRELQILATNLGYTPYPDKLNVPWPILQVSMNIYDEQSKREGSDKAIVAISKAADPNMKAMVTNPTQLAGEKISRDVSRLWGTMDSTEQLIASQYKIALQERDKVKSDYDDIDQDLQEAIESLRTAQKRLKQAESVLSSAEDDLEEAMKPRQVQVGENPDGTPHYELRVDEDAVTRAQMKVDSAKVQVVKAQTKIKLAEDLTNSIQNIADEKKTALDKKEQRLQQAQSVKDLHEKSQREFAGVQDQAQHDQKEPTSVPHTIHKAYRPEHGVATNASRISVRGYLVQLQGNVLLESIEEDLLVSNASEFHRHVDETDTLGRSEAPIRLMSIDQYHTQTRQKIYSSIQTQLSNRLEQYYNGYYESYEKALGQQRRVDALEFALRFSEYVQEDGDGRLAGVKCYTQKHLLDALY